jgi:CheY-like chemotaxis protein/two-component sensor histidine kinase
VRQARQMTRLIEDLLDVNRIVRGKVSLSREPMSLAHAVDKAVGELRVAGRLEHREVRLELQEVWVRADAARIEQIVTNLVGNALKYTAEGGCIAVEARRDGDAAVLRVRDNGIGMSVELTSRVFDLFVQAEGSHRRGGGLGIGLTLVRHLAELQGGHAFAASSGPGQGSVFTVSLPAIEARPNEAVAALAPAPRSRHRILLVEDNAETRDAMFAALQLDGHRVYEAADGEAGLRTIAAVKPDVAVIDIGLPDLDGFEVAEALRASPERHKMVLIAVTGFERPDTLRRAREAGFDQYVAKPVAPEELCRLIDAAFFSRSRAGPRDSALIIKA